MDHLKDHVIYPLTVMEIENIFKKYDDNCAGHLCIMKPTKDESTTTGCASYVNGSTFIHRYPCWLIVNEKGLCLIDPTKKDYKVCFI